MKRKEIINNNASAKLHRKGIAQKRGKRRHVSGVELGEITRRELEIVREIKKGIRHFWSKPHRKESPLNPYKHESN